MLPTIHLGPFALASFSLLLGLAIVSGAVMGMRQAAFLRVDTDVVWRLLPWGVLAGLAGAKGYSIAVLMIAGDVSFREALKTAGQVFYGGIIAGTLVSAWRFRRTGLPLAWLFDYGAPCVAVAHAIGRIGCFLVGDDYGFATQLPWGVAFPHGAPPSTAGYLRAMGGKIPDSVPAATVLAVHPVQLYEATVLLVLGLFLWRASRRPHRPFTVFAWYAVIYGAWRFAIEFLRPKSDVLPIGLTTAQVISVVLCTVGVIILGAPRSRATGAHAG